MAVNYQKRWMMLEPRCIRAAERRKSPNLAPNTTKLRRSEPAMLIALGKSCAASRCSCGEMMDDLPNGRGVES